MTIVERINWLLVYSHCRKPLVSRPSSKKFVNQDQSNAKRFLHSANLYDLTKKDLNVELCEKLVHSIVRLRLRNVEFLTLEV